MIGLWFSMVYRAVTMPSTVRVLVSKQCAPCPWHVYAASCARAACCVQNTTMPSAARAGFILNQWIPNLDRQTVVVNANKNVITADCKTHTEANTALR